MRPVRYLQVDVFTERAGGGNPLGVVVGAQAWSGMRMQAFARWTGLVETTFLLPPQDPAVDYGLRIFTPAREIPFAGHPSVGSAHVALAIGMARARAGRLQQDCGAGRLPLRVDTAQGVQQIAVCAPAARCLRRAPDLDPALRSMLAGIALGATPVALVEGGRRWWLAEFASASALRAWQAPHAAIAALARATDSLGLALFARVDDPGFELVVRAFPCGVGIDEDPASGAANGLIAAWLRECEPQGPLARGYRVSQGREIGRDARIAITLDPDGSVWVGGQTHTVIDGSIDWPDDRVDAG